MRRFRLGVVLSAIALAGAAVAAPPAAAAAPNWGQPAPYTYYLSLGDSLGFGYSAQNFQQFMGDGNIDDFAGYTQQVAAYLQLSPPAVMNMSCPMETTATMINGPCPAAGQIEAITGQTWPFDPQLGAAQTFLAGHRLDRGVITLSIGANDLFTAVDANPSCLTNPGCPQLKTAITTVRTNLTQILRTLRQAAPRATIVVLTPYNPFGHAVPMSNLAAIAFNLTVGMTALFNSARVADAFGPINAQYPKTFDCGYLVFYCAGPAVDPDIHPTATGYGVIATAFEKAIG